MDCILPDSSFQSELQPGALEVPVIVTVLHCSVRTEANGSAIFLGVEWGCGPSAPLLHSGSMGISLYFPPPPEVYVQGALLLYLMHLMVAVLWSVT